MEPWQMEELDGYRQARRGLLALAALYRRQGWRFDLKYTQRIMSSLRGNHPAAAR